MRVYVHRPHNPIFIHHYAKFLCVDRCTTQSSSRSKTQRHCPIYQFLEVWIDFSMSCLKKTLKSLISDNFSDIFFQNPLLHLWGSKSCIYFDKEHDDDTYDVHLYDTHTDTVKTGHARLTLLYTTTLMCGCMNVCRLYFVQFTSPSPEYNTPNFFFEVSHENMVSRKWQQNLFLKLIKSRYFK